MIEQEPFLDLFVPPYPMAERYLRAVLTLNAEKWKHSKNSKVSDSYFPPKMNDPDGLVGAIRNMRSGSGMRNSYRG